MQKSVARFAARQAGSAVGFAPRLRYAKPGYGLVS